MKQKKTARDKRARKPVDPKEGQRIAERSAKRGVPEEELQGPPASETVLMRSDAEIREETEEAESPDRARLTGGDIDADWQRAADVGDEAVGGSVATPDQDRVDDLGRALGVPRAPDEEIRTSTEILEGRDRNRWEQEQSTGGDA
jgi:uncharacterized protein DUF6335